MKAKYWIFNILFCLVSVVAFVYLWKIEVDWDAYFLLRTRRLVKVAAYGLLYVNAARVSYYCLKQKSMKKRFFVSIITSILLLACLMVFEGLMEYYRFEYFFGPAEGYNLWTVIVGDIYYACATWKAAIWYILAFVAYPIIYVLEDIDIMYEIYVFIRRQRIAYHQRALASLLDEEDYEEIWEEDEVEEPVVEKQVINVEDVKKLLDEMKAKEEAKESEEAEESQEVEENEEPEEIQKPVAEEIQ